jgi:high affinity Mn2+ porin
MLAVPEVAFNSPQTDPYGGASRSHLESATTNNLPSSGTNEQFWNLHVATTEVGQYHPAFSARYAGPNSLSSQAASSETVDLDVLAGLRLWQGAELHVDGMAWQGFGFSHTFGIEAFPNAEAYKDGARLADGTFSRVFIRQTIGLVYSCGLRARRECKRWRRMTWPFASCCP